MDIDPYDAAFDRYPDGPRFRKSVASSPRFGIPRTCIFCIVVAACFFLSGTAFLATLPKPMPEPPPGTQEMVISKTPNITQFNQFLTNEEVFVLREIWKQHKDKAGTSPLTKEGGAKLLDNTVTSRILPIKRLKNHLDLGTKDLIARLQDRVTKLAGIPFEKAEGFAFVHHTPGQFFAGQLDAAQGTASRIGTFLIYLNEGYQGGETFFPLGKRVDAVVDKIPTTCSGSEAKNGSENFKVDDPHVRGIIIRLHQGNAVLWVNRVNGVPDPYSRHVDCPLVSGEKLVFVNWLQQP